MMLNRAPRGVLVPVPACAAGVGALWAIAGTRAVEGLPVWWWPVPLLLGWGGVLLAAADLCTQRLPDVLTLTAYPVVASLLLLAATAASDTILLVRAGVGALLWAGGYAAIRLAAPDALGGGDVKLAASVGALATASSWQGLLLAVLLASALTVAVAGPARVLGYRQVPHGPAMLAATWLAVLHPPV
jgi:leader peptidase (prepilin peptidase)/N-methyltransferase